MAVAAHCTGVPVRCMLDRNEDMASSGGRNPFLARYKVKPVTMHACNNFYVDLRHYDMAIKAVDFNVIAVRYQVSLDVWCLMRRAH